MLARYGQTQYLHLHKKSEKLKPTLTEARNSTGVWLINISHNRSWKRENFDNIGREDDKNYWKTESMGDKEKTNSNYFKNVNMMK